LYCFPPVLITANFIVPCIVPFHF